MNRPLRFIRIPALLLTCTASWYLGTPRRAQSTPDQNRTNVQGNGVSLRGAEAFDRFLDSHAEIATQVRQQPWLLTNYNYLQSHPELDAYLQARPQLRADISQNPSAFMGLENRLDQPDGKRDLAELDRFMDTHPEIASQVREKPWLVTNYDFLQSRPELKTFLDNHPQLDKEIGQNPVAFMQEEDLLNQNQNPPVARHNDAELNQFMSSHREIAEQLEKNPSLIDNRDFVQNHPPLQAFLQQNPAIRDEMRNNPNWFNRQDQPPDNNQLAMARNAELRDSGPGRENNRAHLAEFNRFLDSHREIAEQLRKDPSLANNPQFVDNHPALQSFLRNNPEVRQDLRQNANAFMQEEDRIDRQDWRDRDNSHGRMADFGGFLGGHSDIARDMSRDPSIVKNHNYMQQHPELNAYLSAHPDVRDELMANPAKFMKGAQQLSTGGSTTGGVSTGSGTTGSSTGTSTATPNTKPK